ncbi:sigma-54 dependent transcriptional regulator [Planktomarina temperata]|nr:sigma-54 dependent transcriptional regulator [Planktomarina temperata]
MTVMYSKLVGSSEAAMRLKKLISMVGPSDYAAIIQGQTGVGKELVAESLHVSSRRKGKFVAVNCAAIPRDLMEAELFGYEKGAFTGAVKTTPGKFEQANKGTLFLDEIGDMNLDLQSKLLRVLENSIVTRVGGRAEIQLDVRVVCATHKDLEELVKQNKFREDLLFRLNVFPIRVPTLRERSDDIPEIVTHLLKNNSYVNANEAPFGFDKSGLEALTTYEWPGNIRELRNIIERAKVFFPGQNINREQVTQTLLGFNQNAFFDHVEENENIWSALDELGGAERGHEADERAPPTAKDFSRLFDISNSVDVRRLLRDIEMVLIEKALERNAGNTSEAAKDLHLQRTTLIEKIKKYGL